MKKIFFSCFILFLSVSLFAQQDNNQEVIKEKTPVQVKTDVLVKKYQLDKKQAAQMLKIQTRKLRNESEIASLKETNLAKYLDKKQGIENGDDFSIRKMLNDEQRKIFDQAKHDRRTKRAQIANKLAKEGKTPVEIKQATLEIIE